MAVAPTPTARSWAQLCRNADEDFQREATRPVIYEFSNGRKFRQKPDPYSTTSGDHHSVGYPGT